MNRFEMRTPAVTYAYESFVRALHGATKAPRGQARTFDEDGTLIEQGSRNSALASMAGSMRRELRTHRLGSSTGQFALG